jgi:hypothetical protein
MGYTIYNHLLATMNEWYPLEGQDVKQHFEEEFQEVLGDEMAPNDPTRARYCKWKASILKDLDLAEYERISKLVKIRNGHCNEFIESQEERNLFVARMLKKIQRFYYLFI